MAYFDKPPVAVRVGNGVETVFGFDFPYMSANDLVVTVDGTIRPTVLLGTAQFLLSPAPANGARITIERSTPVQNPQNLFASGVPFLPRYVDENSRQLLYAVQEGLYAFGTVIDQASRIASRSLRVPDNEPEIPPLGPAASRANTIMGFDALGRPIPVLPVNGSGTQLAMDLANPADPFKGAAMVARSTVAVGSIRDLQTVKADPYNMYEVLSFYAGDTVGGGKFWYNPNRPKNQHNGWRIIDPNIPFNGTFAGVAGYLSASTATGTGCFERLNADSASPEMAGAVSDWNGTTGSDVGPCFDALLRDTAVKSIHSMGRTYWFGNFTANLVRFWIYRNVVIGLTGCTCIARGEAGGSDYAAALFLFEDCNADIGGFTFDDLSYTHTIAGRGIQPVCIVSRNKTTVGHTVGPLHVIRGQSLLTCAPLGSYNNRSQGIKFRGPMSADTIYYGINLADNGDDFYGDYTLGTVIRSFYVFGVRNVNVNLYAGRTIPASACILLAQYPGSRPTADINLTARLGEVNGPILFSDILETGGKGVYRNISLKVQIDKLGANMPSSAGILRMGWYDAGNELTAQMSEMVTDNIRVELIPPAGARWDLPIHIYTPSTKHGVWTLVGSTPYEPFGLAPKTPAGVYGTPTVSTGGRMRRHVFGDLSQVGAVVRIPLTALISRTYNQPVALPLRITALGGYSTSAPKHVRDIVLLGYIDAAGVLNINSQEAVFNSVFGTPVSGMAVTVSTDAKFLEVRAPGYTNASSTLYASWGTI